MMTREQLDALADQIADFSLRINLTTHALFTHLREFDTHDGWSGSGFSSTAAWLTWRIEVSPSAAREHVRGARALGELHLIDAAFASGKLSYSKVRALTRVATPETEQDFLDIAMHATAAQIERLAGAYRRSRVDPTQPNLDLRDATRGRARYTVGRHLISQLNPRALRTRTSHPRNSPRRPRNGPSSHRRVPLPPDATRQIHRSMLRE